MIRVPKESKEAGFSALASRGRIINILGAVVLLMVRSSAGGQQAADGQSRIDRYVHRYTRITMDPAETERRARTAGRLAIPTDDGLFELRVTRHDLRGRDFRAEEVTATGAKRAVEVPALHTYRGTVEGIPDAEVRFTIRPDSLEGIILTRREWYLVEPMSHYDPDAGPSDLAVYRASDIRPEAVGTCGATLTDRLTDAVAMTAPPMIQAVTVPVADVATEADYEFVTAMGDSAKANTAILEILNQVDGIYQSQLALSLRVVYQHTWATSATPYSSTSPGTLLDQFRNHWETNFGSVNYDLAHLWTGKDMDGSVVGIAYLNVICSARSYSYGLSQLLNYAPGKYILTAHEIGHNFGATHTDQANPAPTDCANTIMNSSIGTGTTFCPFSQNEISTHVTQNASCLATTNYSICDINRDGRVNASDIGLLINVLLGADSCPGSCDINKSGKVEVADLQKLVNVILGTSICP